MWLALAPADAALAAHILGPSILTGIGLAASFAVVAAAMVVLARTKNR